jgi:hypothetical protein
MAVERIGRFQAPVLPSEARRGDVPQSLLPQPLTVGSSDYGLDIERLIVETARNQRDVSRTLKQAARDMIERAHDEQVALMHEKAKAIREWGIAEGLARGCEGALMIGAGSSGNDAKSKEWQGASTMAGAGSGLLRSVGSAEQADIERSIKQAEQSAARAKNLESVTDEMGKDATDLLRDAHGFYREYIGAQKEASQAALRRA